MYKQHLLGGGTMTSIGFELLTERTLQILPNSTFSISILWNGTKIAASVGKDYYHQHSLILPNRRITATGRIHYLKSKMPLLQGASQVSPCRLITCPKDTLEDLQLEINLPPIDSLEPLYRNSSLRFCKKDSSGLTKFTLYFDPRTIEERQTNQYCINLSHLIPRHFSSLHQNRS